MLAPLLSTGRWRGLSLPPSEAGEGRRELERAALQWVRTDGPCASPRAGGHVEHGSDAERQGLVVAPSRMPRPQQRSRGGQQGVFALIAHEEGGLGAGGALVSPR